MLTMMPDTATILRELKDLLHRHFPGAIRDVILFGSRSAGTARDDSDYDVLIVLNKPAYDGKYKKAIRYVCYDLALQYEIFLDVKVISLYELRHTIQGKHFLFTNALSTGVYA